MTTRNLFATHRFWVEIEGITEGYFSECSGLQVETDLIPWEEGGVNEYTHQLPVRAKFSNITLKRGMATVALWQWYRLSHQGQATRRSISVVLQSYVPKTGTAPVFRWNITGALPIKWIGPTLKSDANDVALESIEFAHTGFTLVPPA